MPSEWVSYLSHVGDAPATIFVDIGVEEHEAKELPHLVRVSVAVRERRDNGFPSRADFDEVGALEDGLETALGAEGRYVGRISSGTAHLLHIYTRRPESSVSAVRKLAATLRGRKVEMHREEDPGWSAYLEQLFPSLTELQALKDEAVLQSLREQGDSLSRARQVDHWFFLPNSASRSALAKRLSQEGFRVVDQHDPESEDEQFGLRVARVESVQPEHIKQVTAWLLELADEHGGDYDGWQTSVEK